MTERWANPNEGRRTGGGGSAGIPIDGAGIPTASTVPSTLPIPTRMQQACRAAEGGVCVWGKARLDPVAHAKKSLAKRRPALQGHSSCCLGAWSVPCLVGTAPLG